jgi:hypothetical protein
VTDTGNAAATLQGGGIERLDGESRCPLGSVSLHSTTVTDKKPDTAPVLSLADAELTPPVRRLAARD